MKNEDASITEDPLHWGGCCWNTVHGSSGIDQGLELVTAKHGHDSGV